MACLTTIALCLCFSLFLSECLCLSLSLSLSPSLSLSLSLSSPPPPPPLSHPPPLNLYDCYCLCVVVLKKHNFFVIVVGGGGGGGVKIEAWISQCFVIYLNFDPREFTFHRRFTDAFFQSGYGIQEHPAWTPRTSAACPRRRPWLA